jgi:tetratricopeptide (TPR) repeat protein
MRQANARAWTALQILLAGEEFWERAQLNWERSLDAEFYQPLRDLLDAVTLEPLGLHDVEARRRTWGVLEAAERTGFLTSGALELRDLLTAADLVLGAEDDRQAERAALERQGEVLAAAGYSELGPLLRIVYRRGEMPLLVGLVAALFRNAVEADADLFGDLASKLADPSTGGGDDDFRRLAAALVKHRLRVEELLRGIRSAGAAATVPWRNADAATARLHRGLAHAQRGEYEQAIAQFTAALQLDPALAQALAHRADAHRLQGEYALALADYGAALQLAPSSPSVLLNRGQVYTLLGQHREAVADFDAAVQRDPENALAYFSRGKARSEAGDADGAVADFSAALQHDPSYAWACHYRGETYAAKGDLKRAIADYSQAVRLNPFTPLTYLRRADAYRLRGEHLRAVADYDNALRLDPLNVWAYQYRGLVQLERGKHAQAVADLSRALELDPGNAELLVQRGRVFELRNEFDRAVADFDTAQALGIRSPELYFQRGLAYQALGNRERALADLSQTIEVDPQHALAYDRRASLLAAKGETDKALSDYNAALRIDPGMTAARVHRARVLSRAGRFEEALADCNQALQQDPRLTDAYLMRGHALFQKGEFAAAQADFTNAIKLAPESATAHYLRALTLAQQGALAAALHDLNDAVRLEPRFAQAYARRAYVYNRARQLEPALLDLARAAGLDSRYAVSYCNQRGRVHAAQRQYECALADFALSLLIDPNNVEAQGERTRLEQALQARVVQAAPTQNGGPAGRPLPPSAFQRSNDDILARETAGVERVARPSPVPRQPSTIPEGPPVATRPAKPASAGADEPTEPFHPAVVPASQTPPPPTKLPADAKATEPEVSVVVAEEANDSEDEFELSEEVQASIEMSEEVHPAQGQERPQRSMVLELDESSSDDRTQLEGSREIGEEQIKRVQRLRAQLAARQANEARKKELLARAKAGKRTGPNADERAERRKKWLTGVGLAAGMVAVVFLGRGLFGLFAGGATETIPTLPVERLFADYSANAQAADQKYANKRLIVSGELVVVRKRSDRKRIPGKVIFKAPADVKGLEIECAFQDADDAEGVPKDTVYKVAGQIQPYQTGSAVKLSNCMLLGQVAQPTKKGYLVPTGVGFAACPGSIPPRPTSPLFARRFAALLDSVPPRPASPFFVRAQAA